MMPMRRGSQCQITTQQQREHNVSLNSKTISVFAQEANDAKLLEENMLNKLLRPPAKKENKGQLRKYDPQFQKPDVQKLIHENTILKNEITENKRFIMELKFRNNELEKKTAKLQQNQTEELNEILEKKKKNPSIHTEILKKKIHELHIKFINAEAEIKRLKKLPSASIYEENNIEKQHLLAETIRLKSILTSYAGEKSEVQSPQTENKTPATLTPINSNQYIPSSLNNQKFQQQFLRMLKQENEKLKATIRLLENDKVLMKARQTTQNKQNNDLKKQLDIFKNKLILKDSDVERLTNENKNLLFKKAAQFRIDKEEKESKIISELTKQIHEIKTEQKRVLSDNEQLMLDNHHLKQKQKNKSSEMLEKDQELQKVKIELAEIKNEYEARIKSIQMSKMHKDSEFKSSKSKYLNKNNQQLALSQTPQENLQGKNYNWGKTIKFEELDLCLLKIHHLKQTKVIENYEEIICPLNKVTNSRNSKPATLSLSELYQIFKECPCNFSKEECLRLTNYIFIDHSFFNETQKDQPFIETSLVITILKAAINKFIDCLSDKDVIESVKCLLKTRKAIKDRLQEIASSFMSRQQLIELILKSKTGSLETEEINFFVINGFSFENSGKKIMLSCRKLLSCVTSLIEDMKSGSHMVAKTSLQKMLPLNMGIEEEDEEEKENHQSLDMMKFMNGNPTKMLLSSKKLPRNSNHVERHSNQASSCHPMWVKNSIDIKKNNRNKSAFEIKDEFMQKYGKQFENQFQKVNSESQEEDRAYHPHQNLKKGGNGTKNTYEQDAFPICIETNERPTSNSILKLNLSHGNSDQQIAENHDLESESDDSELENSYFRK